MQRVAGWDLLRGLCALTVALYHLLYWLQITELPALGTYGVYLFFVLSGASLAYNYGTQNFMHAGDVGRFLLARWLRLAPLYIVLCVVFLAMLAVRNGAWVDRIPERMALNASFAFGLQAPATQALLVGGWSLGIEFVYYLFFPWFAKALRVPRLPWALLAVLVGVQWLWIERTVGALGWQAASVAYHHVPAFGAYFFGGCMIGHARRAQGRSWPLAVGVGAWLAMAGLLLALMPQQAGDELRGLRGAVLCGACFAVVWASGHVAVRGRMAKLAAWFGDITYGTYLLHPMLLFALLWFLLPGAASLTLGQRAAVLAGVLVASCSLAWSSERWFERPLRRLGRSASFSHIASSSMAR